MAEEGGGSSGGGSLKRILTKPIAGVPLYVYGGIAVLLLAWYLKKRAASKSKSSDTSGTDTTSNAGTQTFPTAGLMPFSVDTFVNGTTTTSSTDENVPAAMAANTYEKVPDFLARVNALYPQLGLTMEKLEQLNPNVQFTQSNNYGYISQQNPSRPNDPGAGATVYGFDFGSGNPAQLRIK